ncbi:C-signal [Anopheles bellator]|uniref:C-signal n=1 Tax=Anopheles bellator TaxID=139047 RepID=UPI00264779D9|nr:C-signal [Anopheles bellator]
MNSILITGGNRGLGLGLVKTLIRQQSLQKTQIIATYRLPEKSEELLALAKQNANVFPVLTDLTNLERYEQLVNEVGSIVKDEGLNILFNNAGISPKSTRLSFTKADDLVDTFFTNTVAPIMLTKELLPLLKRAADRQPEAPLGPGRACVVNMSSILGSIAENREGGLYAYRSSKAALNAATKSMSLDLLQSGIMAVALHPGWVKTEMGGSKAPLSVDESCDAIVKTLLSLNESHNGGFFQYDGKMLPW